MTATSLPRMPGHRRCCEILGNGDFRAGKELIQQLAHRLQHARARHPWPEHARGDPGALAALIDEMREVVDEINRGDDARRKDELLDVLAVAWRWICDEQREARARATDTLPE